MSRTPPKRFTVTTSWDDGSLKDLKMMELLLKYSLAGTFYIPVKNEERPVMSAQDIRELDTGFEIGSHTYNHRTLPGLSTREMKKQILDGKRGLEQLLGRKVPSFCYPKGKFSPRAIQCVKNAGIKIARTTRAFRISPNGTPFVCDTSLQAFPEKPLIHLRHGLKEFNFVGIYLYATKLHLTSNWKLLAMNLFDKAAQTGGIWHLWGHSWEIEKFGLWKDLEEIFQYVAGHGRAVYLTNGELAENQHNGSISK